MENALRACCKGIKIGKILIHREGDNGQQVCRCFFLYTYVDVPVGFRGVSLSVVELLNSDCFLGPIIWQLIYEKLPQDISKRHVLLLDPILGTGLSILEIETISFFFIVSLASFLWFPHSLLI